MNWLVVLGTAAAGLLAAMIAGVVYTVAVGGIEEDDPRQYVVAGILVAGIVIGISLGCWLTWRR